MSGELEDILKRVSRFEQAAHELLSAFETTPSRVVLLAETRKQVKILSLSQTELFEEALSAMEVGLYRPAVVMSWAGFMDFLQEKLASDGLVKLHSVRPGWTSHKALEDLRENITEYQTVEAARAAGLLNKAEMKALHGLLSKRNECAHPSGYKPNLNEALGYVAELLNRIPTISQKKL